MFQNLRKRFILVAMFSVTIVLISIIGFIDVFYFLRVNQRADEILDYLADHGGTFPENVPTYGNKNWPFSEEEIPYRTRYFTVTINETEGVTSIDLNHIVSVLPSEAFAYSKEVLARRRKTGYFEDYKYLITDSGTSQQIIFLDRRSEINEFYFLVFCSIGITAVSLVIIFILLNYFSKPIIEPVIKNAQKQRQFITDASHELKTPLAIISADTDVIEIVNGKDEWTESIKEQVQRLNHLVQSMLTLSKIDSELPKEVISEFNASELIEQTVREFTPMAVNENKRLLIGIEPQIQFKGNKDAINQLLSVLLNNAFKYSDEHGTIKVKARKRGKILELDVENTTDTMPEGDLSRLFDRFYRADESRSRKTGSYGIGLSVAQAVVQQHKGSIAAKKLNDDTILFRAVLNSF